jgi:hypothetical protein
MVFRLVCFAALAAAAPLANAQQRLVAYEDHNPVDPRPIRLNVVHGTAEGPAGRSIPQVTIGLFTERKHHLVATAETDARGIYSFPQLPTGRYRLVAKAPGYCTANVPIRVAGGLLHFMSVRPDPAVGIHLEPVGAGSCSSGRVE